jgi:hypothetical protein
MRAAARVAGGRSLGAWTAVADSETLIAPILLAEFCPTAAGVTAQRMSRKALEIAALPRGPLQVGALRYGYRWAVGLFTTTSLEGTRGNLCTVVTRTKSLSVSHATSEHIAYYGSLPAVISPRPLGRQSLRQKAP